MKCCYPQAPDHSQSTPPMCSNQMSTVIWVEGFASRWRWGTDVCKTSLERSLKGKIWKKSKSLKIPLKTCFQLVSQNSFRRPVSQARLEESYRVAGDLWGQELNDRNAVDFRWTKISPRSWTLQSCDTAAWLGWFKLHTNGNTKSSYLAGVGLLLLNYSQDEQSPPIKNTCCFFLLKGHIASIIKVHGIALQEQGYQDKRNSTDLFGKIRLWSRGCLQIVVFKPEATFRWGLSYHQHRYFDVVQVWQALPTELYLG